MQLIHDETPFIDGVHKRYTRVYNSVYSKSSFIIYR